MLASTMQFSTFGRVTFHNRRLPPKEVVRRGRAQSEETFPFPQDPTVCLIDQLLTTSFHSGIPAVLDVASSWPIHVNVPPMS
mgnify:FL=1